MKQLHKFSIFSVFGSARLTSLDLGVINRCTRQMFTFKKRATPPQGLLLASVILMLSILVLNLQVLTLAPRYTTFGSQTFQWVSLKYATFIINIIQESSNVI